MGRVPIINKESMSKKATLALTMAAATKGNMKGTIPGEDAIVALDDVLSIVKNISFFGSGTKSYNNPRDELSGSYCTTPVKYEFKDRESKIAAEKVLKDTCGVHCTTPYPTMVRECVKQIINEVKTVFPDNFIRVTIDTDNMVFKVARKPPKTAADRDWQYGKVDIPIPAAALDISTRKGPKDFKIEIPPASTKKSTEKTIEKVTDSVSVPSSPIDIEIDPVPIVDEF
jgi:hypothetical protein